MEKKDNVEKWLSGKCVFKIKCHLFNGGFIQALVHTSRNKSLLISFFVNDEHVLVLEFYQLKMRRRFHFELNHNEFKSVYFCVQLCIERNISEQRFFG